VTRGAFITLEAPDGGGKSKHTRLLADALRAEGRDVLVTHEPTDEGAGAWLRRMLRGEEPMGEPDELARLAALDRLAHVQREILPALLQGRVVICDRYVLSSVVYQGAIGASTSTTLGLNRYAPKPDIVVLLDVPLDVCAERMRKRAGGMPSLYDRDPEMQMRVHAGYAELDGLAMVPGWYLHRVNGNRPVAEVAADIRAAVWPLCVEKRAA
jgi:dTMP kinase